jgi:hypothetical protein
MEVHFTPEQEAQLTPDQQSFVRQAISSGCLSLLMQPRLHSLEAKARDHSGIHANILPPK